MSRSAFVVASLALGIVTGCSGGDKPAPSDDQAFIRGALLELSDFPEGWIETDPRTRSVDQRGAPIERCLTEAARTVHAVSPYFHTGPGTSTVSETLDLFESAEAATKAADRSEQLLACAAESFDDSAFDDIEITASNGRFETLKAADASQRLYLLSADGRDRGGFTFPIHVLVLTGAHGRAHFVFVMQFSVVPSESVRVEFQTIAQRAIARLTDAPRID